jgi:LPPG:FO 2-phospho-L-lactate transferase
MYLALAGGVGGAKLARGLAKTLSPNDLLIAVNTGDDFEHLGLHVSPDLDTVMYTLAGRENPETGWGLAGETWQFMDALGALGGETWFRLGDRDLATHVERTRRLRGGERLSAITDDFGRRVGIAHKIVPMSDDPVRTIVDTDIGRLSFQDYFVRHKSAPTVTGLTFEGADAATQTPLLRDAFESDDLRAIVLCPSNPFLSIMPIFAVPGVRRALEQRRAPLVAVSPIIGGKALKGPAAEVMRSFGHEASAAGVAQVYDGLLDGLIIDTVDADAADAIANDGLQVLVTDTVMTTAAKSAELAEQVVAFASSLTVRPARTEQI